MLSLSSNDKIKFLLYPVVTEQPPPTRKKRPMTHQYLPELMVSEYGYIEAPQFVGRTAGKGRSTFTVTQAWLNGPTWNGRNKQIVGCCNLVGKRGAVATAYIYESGKILIP